MQNAIFDYFYGAALGDTIGQKAFKGNKKPMRHNEEAKDIARKYIDDVLIGNKPDFNKTAKALEISFGNYIEKNKAKSGFVKLQGFLYKPHKHIRKAACKGNVIKLVAESPRGNN